MNIQDNITKFTDLDIDDSLSCFQGHSAQQFHGVYKVFYEIINEMKPKRILEIGTALGGFTTFLSIICKDLNLLTNIRSYDIHRQSWANDLISIGIDIRTENIFTENFLDISDEVKDYIAQEGITLVLCDGGYKIGEFNILSKYIKPKDIIMAHDYAPNSEYFNEHMKYKIWNWHEIKDEDIADACIKYNLKEYMGDKLLSAAWVGKEKYQ
jgi:hypothetical protein